MSAVVGQCNLVSNTSKGIYLTRSIISPSSLIFNPQSPAFSTLANVKLVANGVDFLVYLGPVFNPSQILYRYSFI